MSERRLTIARGRGGGKTHDLVKAVLADENGVLVCADYQRLERVHRDYPISKRELCTVHDLEQGRFTTVRDVNLYFDDAELILERELRRLAGLHLVEGWALEAETPSQISPELEEKMTKQLDAIETVIKTTPHVASHLEFHGDVNVDTKFVDEIIDAFAWKRR